MNLFLFLWRQLRTFFRCYVSETEANANILQDAVLIFSIFRNKRRIATDRWSCARPQLKLSLTSTMSLHSFNYSAAEHMLYLTPTAKEGWISLKRLFDAPLVLFWYKKKSWRREHYVCTLYLKREEKRSLEILWMLDCFCVDVLIKNSTGAGNSDLYEILRLCPGTKRRETGVPLIFSSYFYWVHLILERLSEIFFRIVTFWKHMYSLNVWILFFLHKLPIERVFRLFRYNFRFWLNYLVYFIWGFWKIPVVWHGRNHGRTTDRESCPSLVSFIKN